MKYQGLNRASLIITRKTKQSLEQALEQTGTGLNYISVDSFIQMVTRKILEGVLR